MRSIPTSNIRRLAAKDPLAYYSNYAERFDIAAPGANWGCHATTDVSATFL